MSDQEGGFNFFPLIKLLRAANDDTTGFDGPLGSAAELALKLAEIHPDFAERYLRLIVGIDLIQAGFDPNEVMQELGLRSLST
ncbi:MAG: hypothetical protein HYS86_02585 [Candidatus Chisholmbacteria bacterium]|nr:hypothetical protein [Candidatus Chisholmbacteria bacterium]